MNEKEINKYLTNAKSRIRSAEALKEISQYNDAISRVYYAFFDAATSALLLKGLTAKTHHGLAVLFDEHFIKTGIIDREIGKRLIKMKEEREEADYEVFREFTKEEVERDLDGGKKFIAAIEAVINKSYAEK